MVILDEYECFIEQDENPEINTIFVEVYSNSDPIISDISSEVVNDDTAFFNGYYGKILDVTVDSPGKQTYLKIKTRRVDKR